MGQYPSADLSYGIDFGEWDYEDPKQDQDHEELAWCTWALWEAGWEDWEEVSARYLKSQGIGGVSLTNYGHYDYRRFVLATKSISCCGWGDLTTVKPEDLAITDDDTHLLRAWTLLFPGREPGELAWRLSANFG